MEQPLLFGFAPVTEPRQRPAATYRRVRMASDGPSPQQRELNLKKLLRKIAFRRRTTEQKGIGNTENFSVEGIVKVHQALIDDWQRRFPYCTNPKELYDYWSWMLGDIGENFSFRDCLIASGFMRPDDVIEACSQFAPEWFKDVMELPADQHVEAMQKVIEQTNNFIPARKLLEGLVGSSSEDNEDDDNCSDATVMRIIDSCYEIEA